MQEDEKYGGAVAMLGERMKTALDKVPLTVKSGTTEVRLRVGQPLGLVCGARMFFVDERGGVCSHPGPGSIRVTRADLQDSFVALSGWAVHTHQRELANGYLSVRGGHRAGIAASAVVEDGEVCGVRDVTSINLRIAREVQGAADQVVEACFTDRPQGVLIAGAPASGKTTLLRDLARQLSSGKAGKLHKVCVVDESGEIGGASGGEVRSDLGPCCDLLSGYPKAKGLEIAVRYLSPQVIVCDEICTAREVEAVEMAANSGVAVATSIHAADFEELARKPQYKKLLATGAFTYLVMLWGAEKPSRIRDIRKVEEVCL